MRSRRHHEQRRRTRGQFVRDYAGQRRFPDTGRSDDQYAARHAQPGSGKNLTIAGEPTERGVDLGPNLWSVDDVHAGRRARGLA